MRTESCPSCQANLQGEPIPEEHRTHKANCAEQTAKYGRCFCLPYGDSTHFSRVIGCEIRGVYDGVLYWYCPDCGHAWPREFAHGPFLKLSVRYADLHNERVVSSS